MKNFFIINKDKFLLTGIILLFAGFCYLLFYRFGVHAFIDWDESIYAQVAREAFENHRWFDFTYFGKAWFEKPPLGLWLISFSYALGGVNEWMARLPSVLASVVMIILSLRWVYEIRKTYLPVFFTMVAYFIMYPFLVNSYFVNLDTLVALTTMVALYAWWKAMVAESATSNSNNSKSMWFIVFGISLGLGVMIKNIVGLFPLVPIVLYTITHREFSFLKVRHFWYGALVAAVIVLPWHIYQSITVGQPFWDNYLFYHVLERYSSNLETNGQPFSFFIHLIFFRYHEATILFGGTMLLSVYLALRQQSKHIRFLLISALVLLLIFSISITKLPSYSTMTLPLIVMLAGFSLAQVIKWIPQAWLKVLTAVALAVALAYTGYQFNNYKLAAGESSGEYADNRDVGLFLKGFHPELPVYINNEYYKNLGIGFYAGRPIIPVEDKSILTDKNEEVYHRASEAVYLGEDYILIKR